jgi:serine/threonine-protein kinase
VHRDIKPANIFICRAADEVDVVKVLDFGLVLTDEAAPAPAPVDVEAHADALVAGGKLTMDGGLMGTPAFIPPEQAASQPLDGRADLYALACVAVWLLAARLLYALESPTRLLIAHMMEPVPDLRALLPATVPDALVKLLTGCLQKQPAQRPASVRVFANELRALELHGVWSAEQARAWWEAHHQPSEDREELAAAATVVSLS